MKIGTLVRPTYKHNQGIFVITEIYNINLNTPYALASLYPLCPTAKQHTYPPRDSPLANIYIKNLKEI